MNINRNNYEDFFLLYADGELSATEKKAVESFVSENPDLAQELVLLQQTKLIPDHTIFFENRESLLKSAEDNSLIKHSNYEEFFLLYVDNELDEKNKKAVERFIAQYPELQKELILLQKAHLEPDNSIVFEGKSGLYKKEDRRTVPLPWLRIASAAAVVLLIAGLMILKYSNPHPQPSVAVNKINNDSKSSEKNNLSVTSPPLDSSHNTNAIEKIASTQSKNQSSDMSKVQKKNFNNSNSNIAAKGTDEKDVPMKTKQNMPIALTNKESGRNIKTNTIAVQPNTGIAVAAAKSNTPDIQDQLITSDSNTVAGQVVFADQDQNPEDKISLVTFSPKKSTMRGVFRKITRVFEKTTNVDDNKRNVLVGNFQIALK
ncbi:MAG TPA: hypothetical protein VMH01_04125 [Puia sp.]|nr:hypothetical protein [Puia sp.]